jgi:hypothetical protein
MSSERLTRLGAKMQSYIDGNRLAGAVTLVARRGKVVQLEAQGWRYKEESQPMATDTIFRIASMAKPITSVALMILYEDLIGIVMVQLGNHRHLDHRLNISQLTQQAVIDPHPPGPPRIQGFLGRLEARPGTLREAKVARRCEMRRRKAEVVVQLLQGLPAPQIVPHSRLAAA